MRSSLQLNQPVRVMSVWTATPVTSPVSSASGWPSTRTYRKPCVVWRGSNTSPGRPADTTRSTWPAGSGSGMNGRFTSRWSVVTSPEASTASPCVRVRAVPAGPRFASRTQPLMFWPRSNTCPPATRRTDNAISSSTARTGGAAEATRFA